MKKAFLLFFLIGMTQLFLNAQDAPKKATLVKFKADSLANFELLKNAVDLLKQEGFSFETIDKDFFLCSTKPTRPGKLLMEYRLELSVIDSTLNIRSFVREMGGLPNAAISKTSAAWEKGSNRSLSTSLWRFGWNKQVELANKLKDQIGGIVEYLIE